MLVGSNGTPGSIATWLNNSTIANDAPEIVLEAESWVYRRLRHWRMFPAPVTGNLTIGQDYLTPPSDFLEPAFLLTTGNYFQQILHVPYQQVVMNWSYDGQGNRVRQQPLYFYFDETALRFDSPPDQAYSYALLYFQQPAALASLPSPGVNFLTTYYPRLLRLACMAAACEWAKDSGQGNYDRTYYDTLAQDEIEKAQAESDRAKRSIVAGMVLEGGAAASNFPNYVYGY